MYFVFVICRLTEDEPTIDTNTTFHSSPSNFIVKTEHNTAKVTTNPTDAGSESNKETSEDEEGDDEEESDETINDEEDEDDDDDDIIVLAEYKATCL